MIHLVISINGNFICRPQTPIYAYNNIFEAEDKVKKLQEESNEKEYDYKYYVKSLKIS